MKVVLDTNVYISAFVFGGGNCSKITELARKGEFELFSSLFIIDELSEVLRKKFNWSREQVIVARKEIREMAQLTPEVNKDLEVVEPPADNRILNCCLLSQADYLVTGDKRHLLPLKKYEGTKIVTPATFLEEF